MNCRATGVFGAPVVPYKCKKACAESLQMRRVMLSLKAQGSGGGVDIRVAILPPSRKKSVTGIGLPKHLCDESRSHPAGSAALSFVPPVLAARRAGASPAGSRKRCPVVQPVESPPPFGLGSGGFCKPHLLEAIHGSCSLVSRIFRNRQR